MKKGHQGDVIIAQLKSLPDGAKLIQKKPVALGEHSGHQHVLTGDIRMYEVDNRILAEVGEKGGMLQHIHESNYRDTDDVLPMADHKPIVLEPGVYEFWIQNAYNPYSKLMEKVID